MTDLDDELSRAKLARDMIENPIYKETIDALQREIFLTFKKTGFWSKKEREEAHRMSLVLDRFVVKFEREIETGRLAQVQKLTKSQGVI